MVRRTTNKTTRITQRLRNASSPSKLPRNLRRCDASVNRRSLRHWHLRLLHIGLPRPAIYSTNAEHRRKQAMRFRLNLALIAVYLTASVWAGEVAAAEMKVTLLGTGTPTPRLSSFSASTLIEAGSERLIFDVGRGSSIRLFQKKI